MSTVDRMGNPIRPGHTVLVRDRNRGRIEDRGEIVDVLDKDHVCIHGRDGNLTSYHASKVLRTGAYL